jgi:FAD/FMN-containing dehydrogenase
MVLASGEIINANSTSHPDLTRALHGGSNDFGIVTAFDMRVFPQGRFWGGFVGNNTSTRYSWFDAFASFTGDPNYDPYAALINSYVWSRPPH